MFSYQKYLLTQFALFYSDGSKLNWRFELLFRLVRKYAFDRLVDLGTDVHLQCVIFTVFDWRVDFIIELYLTDNFLL